MKEQEYQEYRQTVAALPTISAIEMGGPDRTLAYGYDVFRNDVHVYRLLGEIHVLVMETDGRRDRIVTHDHGETLPAEDLVISKRAFPDATDRRFAERMAAAGHPITFLGNFDFSAPVVLERANMGPFKAPIHSDFY